MTTEQAKKLSEDALNRLMHALEHGQSDVLKAYLGVMSRFHKYSLGMSSGGKITLLPSLDSAETFSVLVHEARRTSCCIAAIAGRKRRTRT
jgi:hypothetical protein